MWLISVFLSLINSAYNDANIPGSNCAKKGCSSSKKKTQISTISNTEWKGKPVDHKILLGATYIIICEETFKYYKAD